MRAKALALQVETEMTTVLQAVVLAGFAIGLAVTSWGLYDIYSAVIY